MDITWYGLSCFRMIERGKTTVMTDPYSSQLGIEPAGTTRADVVTISHNAPGHSDLDMIKGNYYALNTPGEYEIGGTFITGIPMHYVDPESEQHRYNVGYLMNYDGLTVLHVGDLAHVPQQSLVEELGEVNVLLIPCGGGNSLTAAQASELVSLIEPNYIVPMHYALPGLKLELDSVDKFLKVMGVSNVTETDMLRITSKSNLPEQPEVILLQPSI